MLFAITVKAQSYQRQVGSELSIGVEGALPTTGWTEYIGDGNSIKISDFGIGASLKYAYNFNETIAATFQAGYIFFPGNDLGGGKVNLGQIPIKAGARFSMSRFYIEPQFGLSSFNLKAKADDGTSTSTSTTPFTYAIGIGAAAGENFDIGFRYEAMYKDDSNVGYLALRLAYMLPFGK